MSVEVESEEEGKYDMNEPALVEEREASSTKFIEHPTVAPISVASPAPSDGVSDRPSASPPPVYVSPPSIYSPAPIAPVAPLAIRVLSMRSTYVAQQNHYGNVDPLIVVAIDNRPLFKTSIRYNSTSSSWDLNLPTDVHSVPGGVTLTKSHPPE